MLYSKQDLIQILNLTAQTSERLTDKLGIISQPVELAEYAKPLIDQPYIRNEWVSALINNFVYEVHSQKLFTSMFDRFRRKRDEFTYGTYETVVEPVMPMAYDMTALDRELTYYDTTVRAQYFAINREQVFPMTITRDVIVKAFKSYADLDGFLSSLMLAPRNGNTIVENEAVKEAINKNFAANAFKYVVIDEPSKTNADELAQLIGEAVYSMTVPSADYNKWQEIADLPNPHYDQSDKDDLVFMGTAKSISVIRTYVLAYAFHKEDIEFNFDFVPVGKSFGYQIYDEANRRFIGYQDSPIQFIICDGGFLKLDDNFEFTGESAQGTMTLATQMALHIWQTIGIRAYRNALVFCTAPVVELEADDDNPEILEVNDTATFDLVGSLPSGASTIAELIDVNNITATFGAAGYGNQIMGIENIVGVSDAYHIEVEDNAGHTAVTVSYLLSYAGVESPEGVAVESGDIVTLNIPFVFGANNVQTVTLQFVA